MVILKRKAKKSLTKDKYLAFYLNMQTYSYLSLYTYAGGLTHSSILRAILEDWVADTILENPPEKLIRRVGKHAINSWMASKTRNANLTLFQFKKQLIHELEWKAFTADQIKEILIVFNNGTRS